MDGAGLPDLEPVTPADTNPERGILGPLYGSDIPLEKLPAGLIPGCEGTIADAAEQILGRPCVLTDWDVDLESRTFGLYIVMPDGPEPPYIGGVHLAVYGLMGEVTATREIDMPGAPGGPVLELGLPDGPGYSMRISAYLEPDTLLFRLAAAGLVGGLPELDVLESVLRGHEEALLGP